MLAEESPVVPRRSLRLGVAVGVSEVFESGRPLEIVAKVLVKDALPQLASRLEQPSLP